MGITKNRIAGSKLRARRGYQTLVERRGPRVAKKALLRRLVEKVRMDPDVKLKSADVLTFFGTSPACKREFDYMIGDACIRAAARGIPPKDAYIEFTYDAREALRRRHIADFEERDSGERDERILEGRLKTVDAIFVFKPDQPTRAYFGPEITEFLEGRLKHYGLRVR